MLQLSRSGQHFLAQLLKADPKERISVAATLKHPWLTCNMDPQLATLNDRLLKVSSWHLASNIRFQGPCRAACV